MNTVDLLVRDGLAAELLDNFADSICILDPSFKILFQNRAHRNVLGPHDGEYCYKAVPGRDTLCEACPVEMVFKDGEVHKAIREKDINDHTVYVEIICSPLRDNTGKIIAAIEVARNITEQKVTEGYREELQRMLNNVTNAISESILLLSKEQKILWANETAKQQMGSDVVGKYCYEATHQSKTPCEPPDDPCPIRSSISAGVVPAFTEHIHYDKDGNKIIVEIGAYPIKNATGVLDGFVHISRDVTERKQLEAERENLIRELQKAVENVKQLSGLLPICMQCKKIRNDRGYWIQIENYISEHSEAKFTHGLCDECVIKLYPDFKRKDKT